MLAKTLRCPPVNVGKRSTPNYAALSAQAVHSLSGGRKVFAGQRADAFHVDLGSIFDLGALRPLNPAHLIPWRPSTGINSVQAFNVHTIAIQVPISDLTRDGVDPDQPAVARSRSSASGPRRAVASRGSTTR